MFKKFKVLKDTIITNDMETAKETIKDSLSTIYTDTLQIVRESTFEALVWGEQTIKKAKSNLAKTIAESIGDK